MGHREFGTSVLPLKHRFEWWCRVVPPGAGPAPCSGDPAADFTGRAGVLALGPVHLNTVTFSALLSEPPTTVVRSAGPEAYSLALVLGGAMTVTQCGRTARLARGDFVLWISSRPYEGVALSGPDIGDARAMVLHLPLSLVPLPKDRLYLLLARRLPACSGTGRVLARYLECVTEEAATLGNSAGVRLGATGLDLACGFLAEQIGAQERLRPKTRQEVLLASVDTFIEDNLADPLLSPETVAAHHSISVRHLHQLFRDRPETVAARIRRRRLERCHRDLASPQLRSVPVYAIGARWGLTNAAGFSRAFRAAYGVTPGELRRRSE
ncbi:helix-turn-helix domain-containing protein [Streptomyces sp. NPDC087440]|uniref:AraC-like ligand-binding domain-containing protein n=1 Tax=Streptomyces sp. NPDC087440 TaxID=3365790 RepID=UPI00382274A6